MCKSVLWTKCKIIFSYIFCLLGVRYARSGHFNASFKVLMMDKAHRWYKCYEMDMPYLTILLHRDWLHHSFVKRQAGPGSRLARWCMHLSQQVQRANGIPHISMAFTINSESKVLYILHCKILPGQEVMFSSFYKIIH